MIALTEIRKLELIEECKKVMDESSPDGDIYPIYKIALESLTAVPTYSRYRLSAKGSGPDAEKSPWFAGDGKALRDSHDVEVGNLFTAPPVPEIKLPSRIENIHLRTPLEVEDMWIDRFKRLNGLGE